MPSVGGFILLLLGFVYDVIVSIVRFFLPRSLKPVRSFADDIVLITGAAHGLGRCLALEFAKRGGTLVLWDINKRGLNSVKSEINSSHPRVEVFAYVCNCADREEVYATAERVKSEVGNVSVVINNAGIVTGKMLMDETDDDFERVNTVNSTCHSWIVKCFLPWMLENDYGFIVSIASLLSFIPLGGAVSYATSKAGAALFAESLRVELLKMGKPGVSVTCVCPYLMHTGMFDGLNPAMQWLVPALQPEYVAKKTIEAVSDKQFLLMLPRISYFLRIIHCILPERTLWRIYQFMGVDNIMDTFRGHSKVD
jgi:all-trans-retinol dehydrogenase (NAD+)